MLVVLGVHAAVTIEVREGRLPFDKTKVRSIDIRMSRCGRESRGCVVSREAGGNEDRAVGEGGILDVPAVALRDQGSVGGASRSRVKPQ